MFVVCILNQIGLFLGPSGTNLNIQKMSGIYKEDGKNLTTELGTECL
jgi:hypothetical protein